MGRHHGVVGLSHSEGNQNGLCIARFISRSQIEESRCGDHREQDPEQQKKQKQHLQLLCRHCVRWDEEGQHARVVARSKVAPDHPRLHRSIIRQRLLMPVPEGRTKKDRLLIYARETSDRFEVQEEIEQTARHWSSCADAVAVQQNQPIVHLAGRSPITAFV